MNIHSDDNSPHEFAGNTAKKSTSSTIGSDLIASLTAPGNRLDYTMPCLLEHAHISDLSETDDIARHSKPLPIDLQKATYKKTPLLKDSLAQEQFRFTVRDFFLGDLERIDLSNASIVQPQRSKFSINLHLLGVADKGAVSATPTYMFRCCASEARVVNLDFGYQRRDLHSFLPTRIPLPQAPAIKPIISGQREDYLFTKVGTYIALRENPFSLQMQPFWDSSALDVGMQHLVDLAKLMLEKDSIELAEMTGSGKSIFERSSALLNILYQNVIHYSNNNFKNEAIDGLSAIYVEKRGQDKFYCKLAVVSIECEEMPLDDVIDLRAKSRKHRIFDLYVDRDPYGCIEVSVQSANSQSFYNLDWPDKLPDII